VHLVGFMLFAIDKAESLALLASAVAGLAVAGLTQAIVGLLSVPRVDQTQVSVFEYQRRLRLREGSQVYRWFEPFIDPLAVREGGARPEALARLKRNLALCGVTLPWKPEEYLAAKKIEACLVGLMAFATVLGLGMGAVTGVVLGLGFGFIYVWMVKRQVASRAEAYLKVIRGRLPFVLDLLSLTMEAGASFLESLSIVVKENEKHPLGQQLAEVLRDISVGRTRREALEALQLRLGDEDISEIVFAIIKGEELGTPLSQILHHQADQMRLKRSQWAEKAAGEAQVNIVFPGLIVMIACLVVVVAPFILGALFTPR
jgi:tight adherence protein C